MNVYELVEKVGGEIVRGRARLRVGNDYQILGTLNGDTMEFTETGRLLAQEVGEKAAEPKPRRTRSKKEADLVASLDQPVDDIFDAD